MVLFTLAFFLNDEKAMQVFKDDPIGIIRYMINMEMRENSREIAKLVHDEYFSSNKTYEEQIEQIEKVYAMEFYNTSCIQSITSIVWLLFIQLTADYGLFKCTDESVKLFSQYNKQPTYYYYYSHRGQISFPQLVGVSPEIDLGTYMLAYMIYNSLSPLYEFY